MTGQQLKQARYDMEYSVVGDSIGNCCTGIGQLLGNGDDDLCMLNSNHKLCVTEL